MLHDDPDFELFAAQTRCLVQLKAQYELAKEELEVYQAELCRQKPRDSTVKLIGLDAESKAQLVLLRNEVGSAKLRMEEIEAELSILKFQRDMAKVRYFNGKV